MTGEEIIVTFKEPWYNDYTRRLYTQLSEQMIREEIERVHKEPIITNAAFDIAVILVVLVGTLPLSNHNYQL